MIVHTLRSISTAAKAHFAMPCGRLYRHRAFTGVLLMFFWRIGHKVRRRRRSQLPRLKTLRSSFGCESVQCKFWNAANTPRKCEMHDARRCFLCNNIARMGLQKHNKHARCVIFVTTLQGWVYKTQQTPRGHARSMMLVWYFLCNNIARRGLQKRRGHARCMMLVWCFLCNNIARRGLQKRHGHARCVIFVTILQGWVYKKHNKHDNIARNPVQHATTECAMWIGKRPDINVVLNYKVTDSVISCCPGKDGLTSSRSRVDVVDGGERARVWPLKAPRLCVLLATDLKTGKETGTSI